MAEDPTTQGAAFETRQVRELQCRVTKLIQATHDVRILHLTTDAEAPFDFLAGQYAKLRFAALPPRDYSMANPPGDDTIEFHIRRMGGEGASDYVSTALKPGETVGLEGPFGEAYLRGAHGGPILAIAGGSGLAPIKSIVETALMRDPNRDVHLYFGVREERDLYLEQRFQTLCRIHSGLRFEPVVFEGAADGVYRRGSVADALAEDLPDLTRFKAYLAGPPVMVEASVEKLLGLGMADLDIHADPFYSDEEQAARLAARKES